MHIVVTYDISDDKRRNRVARCLEDHGRRVQWSVFDCQLDERQLGNLWRELAMIIDQELDSVRFYRLCKKCRQAIDILGVGNVRDDDDVVIV